MTKNKDYLLLKNVALFELTTRTKEAGIDVSDTYIEEVKAEQGNRAFVLRRHKGYFISQIIFTKNTKPIFHIYKESN